MKCPVCGSDCYRDEVDIGVGVQYGPWFCQECPWGEEDGREALIEDEEHGEPF